MCIVLFCWNIFIGYFIKTLTYLSYNIHQSLDKCICKICRMPLLDIIDNKMSICYI